MSRTADDLYTMINRLVARGAPSHDQLNPSYEKPWKMRPGQIPWCDMWFLDADGEGRRDCYGCGIGLPDSVAWAVATEFYVQWFVASYGAKRGLWGVFIGDDFANLVYDNEPMEPFGNVLEAIADRLEGDND